MADKPAFDANAAYSKPAFNPNADYSVSNSASTAPQAITQQEQPGFFKRLAQSVGLPSSVAEADATVPHSVGEAVSGALAKSTGLLQPIVNYAQNAGKGIAEGAQDVVDAGRNIVAGQPILPNIGKAASGGAHAILQATPVVGPSIDTAGQDIAQGNYAGAAGGLTGAIAQVAAPDALEKVGQARDYVAQKAVEPLVNKTPTQAAADLDADIKPGQSIVDEGLVGTKKSLVKKANQRIGELSSQTDQALKNSPNANVQIDAGDIIDGAIDSAQKAALKSGNPAIVTRLDNLKNALQTQFGSLQGTPLEMQRLKQSIGDTASDLGSFKTTDPLEASAAGALKDIYSRLNDAIAQQVPETATLNDRVSRLISDRDGVTRSITKDSGKSVLDSTGLGATLLKMLQATVTSAPIRTGIAKILR